MAVNVNDQQLDCYRGEDREFVFNPLEATTITAWTLQFTVAAVGASPLLTPTVGSGIALTDTAAGKITVSLTRAQTQTLTGSDYQWDLWRTGSGANQRLAGGPFLVRTPTRPQT